MSIAKPRRNLPATIRHLLLVTISRNTMLATSRDCYYCPNACSLIRALLKPISVFIFCTHSFLASFQTPPFIYLVPVSLFPLSLFMLLLHLRPAMRVLGILSTWNCRDPARRHHHLPVLRDVREGEAAAGRCRLLGTPPPPPPPPLSVLPTPGGGGVCGACVPAGDRCSGLLISGWNLKAGMISLARNVC